MHRESHESEPELRPLHGEITKLLAQSTAHQLVEACRETGADVHEMLELLFWKVSEAVNRRVLLDQGDASGYRALAEDEGRPLDEVLPDPKNPMKGTAKIIMALTDNRISHEDARAYYAYRCFLLEQGLAVTALDALPWDDTCLERTCDTCGISAPEEAKNRIANAVTIIRQAGLDAREWHFLIR